MYVDLTVGRWTVGLPLPDLSKIFRSRTYGYYFQLTVGITHVVVRHLLHSYLSLVEPMTPPTGC